MSDDTSQPRRWMLHAERRPSNLVEDRWIVSGPGPTTARTVDHSFLGENVEVMPVAEHDAWMRMQEAEDYVEIRSSESGRRWGISVDIFGGKEHISICELESEPCGCPKCDPSTRVVSECSADVAASTERASG